MLNKSYWQTVEFERQPSLVGDISCTYAIIGAGLCGLMCAFELTERGVSGGDIVIIDADRVCSGASACTTAKLTVQHGLIYDRLIREYGQQNAQQYMNINRAAVSRVRRIVEEHHIDCDLQTCRSLVYASKAESVGRIAAEAAAVERLGLRAQLTDETELPFKVQLAVALDGQAKFHPLKFAGAIYDILMERGCRFYEQTTATAIRGGSVITAEGQIHSQKIIVSSHYPFADMRGLHFAKLYQRRSYVLAIENAAAIEDNYYCCDGDPVSFRGAGDTLLIAGASRKCGDQNDFGSLYSLIEKVCQIYPECMVVARWANQDVMSYAHLPVIGPIGHLDSNVMIATAFNRWGMTTSVAAAGILADMLTLGTKEPEIVSPARHINRRTAAGFVRQMGEIATEFATDLTSPRCSHMGCPLHFNAADGTWDCPCHGSRFDTDGNVLHGPAKKCAKIDKDPPLR